MRSWAIIGAWLSIGSAAVQAAELLAPPPSSATGATAADDELRASIRALLRDTRDVPLPLIIAALTGHRVLPWDGQARDALDATAAAVLHEIATTGIRADRANEAGNAVEPFVLAALRAHGFAASRPHTASGRMRAAGYPDLEARRGDAEFYVEVKSYNAATVESTQRTFYLSPSADFKVAHDAHHLLIAVELAPDAAGVYRARSVRWLDLARLRCDLKHEFNANNRDLYGADAGLIILETPAAPDDGAAPLAPSP